MSEAAAQSLLEKAPVADLTKNISTLQSHLTVEAAAALDQHRPLFVYTPKDKEEKEFLCSPYNAHPKNNTRHRSPWTNRWHPQEPMDKEPPPLTDAQELLRALEVTFNEVWGSYKNLYYGHQALSSVYLKPRNNNNNNNSEDSWEGQFMISKTTARGQWESCSHVMVDAPGEKDCQYTVSTTVTVILDPEQPPLQVSAKVKKTTTKVCKINASHMQVSHIENVGEILESNEMDLRSNLERVYIPKNQEIVSNIQKKKSFRPPTNPLMGMVMSSDMLKKKLNKG